MKRIALTVYIHCMMAEAGMDMLLDMNYRLYEIRLANTQAAIQDIIDHFQNYARWLCIDFSKTWEAAGRFAVFDSRFLFMKDPVLSEVLDNVWQVWADSIIDRLVLAAPGVIFDTDKALLDEFVERLNSERAKITFLTEYATEKLVNIVGSKLIMGEFRDAIKIADEVHMRLNELIDSFKPNGSRPVTDGPSTKEGPG